MPDDVSAFMRACVVQAAEYRYKPRTSDDAQSQQHLRDMERRWLDLAMSCEFAYRFSRSVPAAA